MREIHGSLPQAAGGQSRLRALGYCGAVPLIVLAVWLFAIAPDHPWHEGTILLLKTYAAMLLSFLGGTRWGAVLAKDDDGTAATIALLPALSAWIALLLPPAVAFAGLAVAFAAQGAWDSLAAHAGSLPVWYGALRARLTVIAVATMILAFAATVWT
ncbi:MAG: DUF3429 domain-containing protein [Rhizobiaceae bacterium]|nr:DUF3429 domain-containing protein [Rhizobiaceae bacterium]